MERKDLGYNEMERQDVSEEDIKYMKEAIKQAKKAGKLMEVPPAGAREEASLVVLGDEMEKMDRVVPMAAVLSSNVDTAIEQGWCMCGEVGLSGEVRLVYCLQNGLPLDMDVYDLAEWCSLAELGALSMDNNRHRMGVSKGN